LRQRRQRLDATREVLAGAGYTETWNPALVRTKARGGAHRCACDAVMNALSDDMDTLRTSLLPS